jgi:MinD-like ATPase involved in chromosome partitioning or flagellar assembly
MLVEGKVVIITFHSYKGGTGKTLLSVNLAVTLANSGKKTCLLDLDFSAPSLHAVFKTVETEYWLNDYLNRACEIDKVLKDCGVNCVSKGRMFVGLANPSSEAIRDMSAKDRRWEMEALGRLLSLKNSLLEKLDFDHVIFDTSPGLQYSSINAVVSADAVFVVTTLDKSDLEGTQRMIRDFYGIFDKKAQIILNKVPFDFLSIEKQTKFKWLQLPVAGAIPCSCDILEAEGECFFAAEKPNHVFSRTLREVAAKNRINEFSWF